MGVIVAAGIWKVGDLIKIRFCDVFDNQVILGKTLIVVCDSEIQSPCWTEVEHEGKFYTVRGSEARKA